MIRARARKPHKPGTMNKLETAYSAHLETLKRGGIINDYRFECVRFILAPKTSYTPDFMVIYPDGTISFHETKGYWEDDARVKIKVTAKQFPWYQFTAVTRKKGDWVFEFFGGGDDVS